MFNKYILNDMSPEEGGGGDPKDIRTQDSLFCHSRVNGVYLFQAEVAITLLQEGQESTRERKGQSPVCSPENSRTYLRGGKDSVSVKSVCVQGICLSPSW